MGILLDQLREWLKNQGFTSGESDQVIGGLIVGIVLAIGGSVFVAWRLGAWSIIVWLAKKIAGKSPEPPESAKTLSPNIPPDSIEFVSRSDDQGRNLLELITKALEPEKNKFIALWGEGGVGKTTLAKEAARSLISVYGNRIVFSSAEGKDQLYTFSTLLEDIAKHFQREDVLQLGIQDKLIAFQQIIAESPTLLILDNFETISREEQQKCADFLSKTSPFPALITTRDVDGLRQAIPLRIEAMTPEEAEQFLQQITAPYDVNIFTPEILQRIMQEAARTPLIMGWLVEQIRQARKVEAVFDDLKKGKGTAAERIFARSFRLPQLGADGRAALLALSIFAPSAPREALGVVAGFSGDAPRLDESLARLISLRLIKASDNNDRFSVQGLTRELAQNYLINSNAGEQSGGSFFTKWWDQLFLDKSSLTFHAPEFHARFIDYFLQEVKKNKQQTAKDYDDLEAEKDNLLMAINLAFDLQNWDDFFYLAQELTHCTLGMLSIRGYWNEAISYGEKALDIARDLKMQLQIAFFTHSLAVSYGSIGDTQKEEEFYFESLEISVELEDLYQVSRILNDLASLKAQQGDNKKARELFMESIEIKEKLDDKEALAGSYMNLGVLEIQEGNLEGGNQLLVKSLNIHETLDNPLGIANAYICFGTLASIQGDFVKAEQFYLDGLNIYQQYRHQESIAYTFYKIGVLRWQQNKQDEAREYMKNASDILLKLGSSAAEEVLDSLNELDQEIAENEAQQ
jgi:tetratricopeptide (TPR) repeat protein